MTDINNNNADFNEGPNPNANPNANGNNYNNNNMYARYTSEKKMTAGILGIALGSFGVHKFYLGYTKEGIIQIIITIVTCGLGGLVGFIEGILYITKSDEEFDEMYVRNEKGWF